MNQFDIELNGNLILKRMGRVINTTSGNLGKYKEHQIQAMKKAVISTAKRIELEATDDAPSSERGTKFINIDTKISNGGLTAEVGVFGKNNLAAYFEFGTGLNAIKILRNYPRWIRNIAWQFYVDGSGRLKGKPYLYPSVLKNTPLLEKELYSIQKDKPINDNG